MEEELQQEQQEAISSITAGYNKQRGIEEAEKEPEVVALAEEPVVDTPPEPTPEDRYAQLASRVDQLADTPTQISKLHGKIGELNRTLLALQQTAQQPGQASPELAAALEQAETVAADFPELAGPLVNAIKALGTGRQVTVSTPPPDIDSLVSERVTRLRQEEAIEILTEEHPDWQSLRDNPPPEYKAWLASKSPEFQQKYLNTWNPAVVSRGLSDYKQHLATTKATKETRQQRVAAAVTPPGEGSPGPNVLPDSAGLSAGYNRIRRLGSAR